MLIIYSRAGNLCAMQPAKRNINVTNLSLLGVTVISTFIDSYLA